MSLCICLTIVTFISAAAFADESHSPAIRFNDQIRPILSEYCFACHGPDSSSREAGLRLDDRSSAVDGGAVVPGEASQSEMIARINSADPALVMPPPDSHKVMPPELRKLLVDWINHGAEWEKHWAFIKPKRPAMPSIRNNEAQQANPVDQFVLRQLTKEGLKPNSRADRYTLARRAALDVTGLPPTTEMLRRFVEDKSPEAWSGYIDRLLASKHAGEHRARYWLDAARYGDTHGMHVDNYREIWPYRDWVVNAFNSNMPFDRFVVEQLAGDLLPNPSQDQLIATGFNRCNITTSEGGAIPEEVGVRYMVDRVETTSTVFLGLTTGCAVCHDHKYDPISQREFYQLGAFFNNTTQPAMDGNQKDTPPVVTLPADEFRSEWEQLVAERGRLRNEIRATITNVEQWWPQRNREMSSPISTTAQILSLPLTEEHQQTVQLPERASWATEHPAGKRGMRFGENGTLTANLPQLRSDAPLTISFWIRSPDRLMSTTIFDQTQQTKDKKTLGWKIAGNTQGGLTFEFHDGTGARMRALLPGDEALKPRSWQHVCIRYSGGQSNSSVSILLNGRAGILRNSSEEHIAAVEVPATSLRIASRMPTGGLSDIRLFGRWLTDPETSLLAAEFRLKQLVATDAGFKQLDEPQRSLAELYHRSIIDTAGGSRLNQYAETQQRRDYIYSRSTTTLVMQERPEKPRAWILARGEYDQRRDEVAPMVPNVLNFANAGFPFAANAQNVASGNRLDLARWLVHPDHPLTARVMVNRLWQSIFGIGLVKTSEDFGVMGEPPSNPELLDWLAVEFVKSGWNVKHILKLILTSSTYKQSSVVRPDEFQKDPENRLLARGPRLRLDAEVLRDQALAVSGLLRREMGGPSVKPYQPAGLWKVVAITGSNTRIFEKDTGDALYRRSVYSFWKRTSPPPNMAAFNAPTREQCTVRRERTNTPIQALVLMNDPQFVECARELAQNTIKHSSSIDARAKWIYLTALCRPALPDDLQLIAAAIKDLAEIFSEDPDSAKAFINTGDSKPDEKLNPAELAAWTIVANTLMNRDDFINN